MPKVEPNSLTQNNHQTVTCSKRAAREASDARPLQRQETLSRRLAQACLGRENHADLFSLIAERDPASRDTLLAWTDEFTGQAGQLGSLRPKERDAILRALFDQLRAWRKRCENYGYPKAMAAGGRR